jgi:dTDP-4-amino-4,6-dideoxygalactose transaminase
VKHVVLVSSGTTALQLLIRAFNFKREVITTPFSYVATTSSLVWEKCQPVFADIHPDTLCIDPLKIEALIHPETDGIIATHIFGVPCKIDALTDIAKAHQIPLIFDAAHAFGSAYKGASLCSYGDGAALSLHATKLFHTGEGGAIITHRDDIAETVKQLRNFGQQGTGNYPVAGINAKLSELHAAIGLSILPEINQLIKQRSILAAGYRDALQSLENIQFQHIGEDCTGYNHAYFPLIISCEENAIRLMEHAAAKGIEMRRYCYPSLNQLPYLTHSNNCPVSEDLAARTVCIPIYPELSQEERSQIIHLIKEVLC